MRNRLFTAPSTFDNSSVEQFKGRYEEVYSRWFGRDGALFYPLDRATRDYLADVSIWAK